MNPPDLPSCKDPVGVCLWMMANLAPLFNIESADPNLVSLNSNFRLYTTMRNDLVCMILLGLPLINILDGWRTCSFMAFSTVYPSCQGSVR